MSARWRSTRKRIPARPRHYWGAEEAIKRLSNLTRILDPKEFRGFLLALADHKQNVELIDRTTAIASFLLQVLDWDEHVDRRSEIVAQFQAVSDKLARKCQGCGKHAGQVRDAKAERRLDDGRAHYCSNACRQKAYRLRYNSANRSEAGNVTNPIIVTPQANGHIEQS